jgi:predicted AlkP superfamily pyrophosphatase or phosphodiesterase
VFRRVRIPRTPGVLAACLLLAAAPAGPGPRQRLDPTVILISLDGFRWDYFGRTPTPNMDRLVARGVRARWMVPAFPSLTFPNHYTIVTGLYPEHHGIVANSIEEPASGLRFGIGDTAAVRSSHWWGGEPLWVTAERQGVHAATYFWPGSEASIGGMRPSFSKAFDNRVPGQERVDGVLGWLGLPREQRPRFVTMYFSDVDHAGHQYGPDSPRVLEAVRAVDSLIGLLVTALERHGLLDQVNIVVVSDHGMAPMSPDRVIWVDDYVDPATLDIESDGAELLAWPRGADTAAIVRALAKAPHLTVYTRDQVPERLHYRANPRIPAIVALADEGWDVRTRAKAEPAREFPRGGHGYDNALPSMRAILIAAGPAFKQGYTSEAFQNIHVYDLLCAVLGLQPAPNDGSPDSTRALLR